MGARLGARELTRPTTAAALPQPDKACEVMCGRDITVASHKLGCGGCCTCMPHSPTVPNVASVPTERLRRALEQFGAAVDGGNVYVHGSWSLASCITNQKRCRRRYAATTADSATPRSHLDSAARARFADCLAACTRCAPGPGRLSASSN